jgi:hypothetical protein
MDTKELREQVEKERKKVAASTKKRNTIVILLFIVVYFLLLYFLSDKPADFNDYFGLILSSCFLGVLHHAINGAIYEELHKKEASESCLLEELQEELFRKENEQIEKVIADTKKRLQQ